MQNGIQIYSSIIKNKKNRMLKAIALLALGALTTSAYSDAAYYNIIASNPRTSGRLINTVNRPVRTANSQTSNVQQTQCYQNGVLTSSNTRSTATTSRTRNNVKTTTTSNIRRSSVSNGQGQPQVQQTQTVQTTVEQVPKQGQQIYPTDPLVRADPRAQPSGISQGNRIVGKDNKVGKSERNDITGSANKLLYSHENDIDGNGNRLQDSTLNQIVGQQNDVRGSSQNQIFGLLNFVDNSDGNDIQGVGAVGLGVDGATIRGTGTVVVGDKFRAVTGGQTRAATSHASDAYQSLSSHLGLGFGRY